MPHHESNPDFVKRTKELDQELIPPLRPLEALDRVFAVIRTRAAADPTFARSFVQAVGSPVVFRLVDDDRGRFFSDS